MFGDESMHVYYSVVTVPSCPHHLAFLHHKLYEIICVMFFSLLLRRLGLHSFSSSFCYALLRFGSLYCLYCICFASIIHYEHVLPPGYYY